jgi:predicted PurR-regulated permease PerM
MMEEMTTFPPSRPLLSRERAQLIALVGATALAAYLSYRLIQPFLGALAWALALAIVAEPLRRVLCRWVAHRTAVAVLALAVVVVLVAVPVVLVTQQVGREAARALDFVQEQLAGGRWRGAIGSQPWLAAALAWLESHIPLDAVGQRAAEKAETMAPAVVGATLSLAIQVLVAALALFYFFRDRGFILDGVRALLPLSDVEVSEVFRRVEDTIHATVFGTLTVSAVQGSLGGLMFWALGLPGPVLWAAVMTVCALIPTLGAFVVWLPAAGYLALTGAWGKAAILVAWGMLAVGLVDNLLYPTLVGHRLRLHTLPVFFSIVGGLYLFGAAGLVLGPVTLAVTIALLDIWRRRTVHGRPAERPLDERDAASLRRMRRRE